MIIYNIAKQCFNLCSEFVRDTFLTDRSEHRCVPLNLGFFSRAKRSG